MAPPGTPLARRALTAIVVLLTAALAPLAASCDRGEGAAAPGGAAPTTAARAEAPPDALALVFPYGSEKKQWMADAVAAYHATDPRSTTGRPVRVDARPMGSGEAMAEVLEGRLEANLVSPASGAFVELANAISRARTGGDLVPESRNLVLSPVVIAMWRPMAEALGWPGKPVGWSDVLAVSAGGEGWAALGHPEWGDFKFGHTHPEYSNSGLIAVLAEVYAGSGKRRGLTLDDLADAKTQKFVADIERSVVHYGSSTGFFGDKMFSRGPGYLSAAVLYENMVIESYDRQKHPDLPLPVVAIYPAEGTFWSDHPAGVVDRPWNDDEHRAAATAFLDFLLRPEQQRAALAYGFRPGEASIPLASPIDAAHGVDPAEPRTTLAVPPADVVQGAIALWQRNKKPADVVLVLDTSGSMKGGRIDNAKAGARQMIDLMGDADRLSVVPFSSRPAFAMESQPLGDGGRATATSTVDGLFADGGTALYDAVFIARNYLKKRAATDAGSDAILAVVVLTDGDDTQSRLKLDQLLATLQAGEGERPIRVFTIGYGGEADQGVLKRIADQTDAKAYEGTPENIREVFKDIATFF